MPPKANASARSATTSSSSPNSLQTTAKQEKLQPQQPQQQQQQAAQQQNRTGVAASSRSNNNNNNLSAHQNNDTLFLQRGASGHNLGASYANAASGDFSNELAHEKQQQDFAHQRQELEREESVHRQRHEAMQSLGLKLISIEFSKKKDPLGYFRLTKPAANDDIARHICTVKLMTCNRAMKPFAIPVPLPATDSALDSLTLGELKNRIFESAKDNFVDPILLPLLKPHMQVLYNSQGKQIGRVEDRAAMDKWIAAHPPPTKKLTAAEKASLPAPPPMPTVESNDACVRDFGVEYGSTFYVAIRVAAQEVAGSDAHEQVEANRPEIIPPVNPKDLKKRNVPTVSISVNNNNPNGTSGSNKKAPNSASTNPPPTSPSAGRRRG